MRYKEKKLIGISLILTISMVFLLAVSVAEAGEEDYTISELQQKFNAYLNLKYPSGIIDSGNMEPYLYDPYLAGFNSMYEATQNKSYIDLSLKNAENLFSRLVDVDYDGYREWVSDSPNSWWAGVDHDNNPDTPNISTCVSMLRGVRQVAKLVRLIKNDNLLNKEYGNRADLLIFAIKNDILYHPTCTCFTCNADDSWLDVVCHPALVSLELYLIDGEQEYLNYAKEKANIINNAKKIQGNTIIWMKAMDGVYGSNIINDVSHTEAMVYAAAEFYRAGIIFTIDDINKLSNTFLTNIWNGNEIDPVYNDLLNGGLGTWNANPEYWLGSNIAPGWVGLGAFNNTLHKIVEAGDKSIFTNKAALNYLAFYGELARNLVAKNCRYTNNAKEICDNIDNDCDGAIDENLNCFVYGDVSGNGEVTAYDASLTAQKAVGLITLAPEQTQKADVSGNGEVSAYDAALITQRAFGL